MNTRNINNDFFSYFILASDILAEAELDLQYIAALTDW